MEVQVSRIIGGVVLGAAALLAVLAFVPALALATHVSCGT
jgi:hypothetical protein